MNEARRNDPAVCPLCGHANRCAIAAGESDEPCWCTQVTIDTRVLDRVPSEMRGIACICPECASGVATRGR